MQCTNSRKGSFNVKIGYTCVKNIDQDHIVIIIEVEYFSMKKCILWFTYFCYVYFKSKKPIFGRLYMSLLCYLCDEHT